MKTIELSLSKNYVCNWGLWEAIREIMQNAQDAEKEGYPLSVTYDEDYSELIISNTGTKLNISSLVLGNTTKDEDERLIGKYGEGYKLALLVLLRLGKEVRIYTENEKWTPSFAKSKTFNTEVLVIHRELKEGTSDLDRVQFVIEDITLSEFDMLKKKSLRIMDEVSKWKRKVVDCDYGQILLDSEYRGKFYVEGLFIQTDENFKYGYSFNSDVVDLDRDRKAINYYDLCELTTKSLLSQTTDFEIVETSISKKTHDSKDLQYFYTKASDEFKEGYAKNYVEKHNISEDTFIGTEKEVKLSDAKQKIVVDEITAEWVNDGLGKGEEYREIKSKAKRKNDKDIAYKYYDSSLLYELHEWIRYNYKRISKKELESFMTILEDVDVTGISSIREEITAQVRKDIELDN